MTNADWANKDFYKVLGLAKDASGADVKKAYRKLARANHPDAKPGDKVAEERFKVIAEAYDVVGDPAKREQYDEMRSMVGSRFPGGFGGRPTAGTGQPFDINDFLGGRGGGGAGDPFGGMFGGGGARQAQARRGADVETEATISFTDAIEGVTISLRLSADAPCPDCSGTGAKAGTMPRVCPQCEGVGMVAASMGGAFTMNETCPVCRGRGLVVEEACPTCRGSGRGMSNRTIQARIPAGVKNGQQIRLRGKGANGERGGPSGDLYVNVHVSAHSVFGRKGDNLTVDVPVTFDEAALGADIKVPTLNGLPVTVKIPAGTPNGRTFRVRGHGVVRKDGHKADLLVTVGVQVPAVLNDEAREAVTAYREATSDSDIRANLFNGGGS